MRKDGTKEGRKDGQRHKQADRQTDRHDEANSLFSQFPNTPSEMLERFWHCPVTQTVG
jgi:hypothetical protein